MIGSISPLGSQLLSKPTSIVPGRRGRCRRRGRLVIRRKCRACRRCRSDPGNLRQAEQLSLAGLQGKADTREVVDAVMSAEQSLQTAIAIRDKVVRPISKSARMPI
jgi:flagellar hook-basal body complex protein FliE